MIQAVMIDSREPEWVQHLTFGGAPTAVVQLDHGDVHVLCDDGNTLVIERKTSDDLLNTLKDERLLPQMAGLVQSRLDEQAAQGHFSTWPYLVITGLLYRDSNGKVVTSSRQSNWNWDAVQGALLSIQEMGVMVCQAGDDGDFEACVIRLANRKRDAIKIIPPRVPNVLGPGAAFLASLPGVGIELSMRVLDWAGGVPAHALAGIVDLDIACPLPHGTRRKVRAMLGLREGQTLDLSVGKVDEETLDVFEKVGG